jgi:putative glycosyltransferase (TIGR04372 family)
MLQIKKTIKDAITDYLGYGFYKNTKIEVELNKYFQISDPQKRYECALKLVERYPEDPRTYNVLLNVEHYLGKKNQFNSFNKFNLVRNNYLKNSGLGELNFNMIPSNTIAGAFGNYYTLETLINNKQNSLKKILVTLSEDEKITNKALFKYFEKEIILIKDTSLSRIQKILELPIGVCIPADKSCLYLDLAANFSEQKNLIGNKKNFLKLSNEDIEIGSKYLKKCGINMNDWFVTLHVRETTKTDSIEFDEGFRNSNPHNYIESIKYIVKNGGYVFRMGDKNTSKLENINGLIDYAHSEDKNESLDIFLGAMSKFCIGTSSGYFRVPRYFGVPVLLTNQPQTIEYFSLKTKDMFLPKKVLDLKSSKTLNLLDSFKFPFSFFSSLHRFNKTEFGQLENSPSEILDSVIKMLDKSFSEKISSNFPKYLKSNFQQDDLMYGDYRSEPFAEISERIIDE